MTHISIAPIQVKVLAGGGLQKASTVYDLKAILLHYWTVTDGPYFFTSSSVSGSPRRKKSVETTPEVFLAAAREADATSIDQ
jgi:hypothetical protein